MRRRSYPYAMGAFAGSLRYHENGTGGLIMRIIFVRHGEPDYENDCLTETGRRQAAAAAEIFHNSS